MNVKVPFALVFTDAVRTHVTDPLVRLRSTTSVLGSTLSGLPHDTGQVCASAVRDPRGGGACR